MAEAADLHLMAIEEVEAEDDCETLDLSTSDPSSHLQIPMDIIECEHDLGPGYEFLEYLGRRSAHLLDQVDPFPCLPDSSNFSVLEEDDGMILGIEDGGGGGDRVMISDWGPDEFFRRSSESESLEFFRRTDEDGLRIVEFDSDSDSGDQIVAIGDDSDRAGAPDLVAGFTGFSLCWDDRREADEEFEWEEVEEADGCLEDREFLGMGEETARVLAGVFSDYDQEDTARNVDWVRAVEWEVLVSTNSLLRSHMGREGAESYFIDDHEGFVYTSEYDALVGQIEENENLKGTPPAAKSVVKNLPSVVLTDEDIANKNATCAVCKDEIPVQEKVKKLPCSHHYHEECILRWLGMRNTCPLCRFELPTDDPEYENWKAQRDSGGDYEEGRLRYEFEILPEA